MTFQGNRDRMNPQVDRVSDMLGVPDRGEHHLAAVSIIIHRMYTLLDQTQCIVPLVLQASHQGADIRRTCGHGHVRLLERVDEMHIDLDALVGKPLARLDAFQGHRELENRRLLAQPEPKEASGFLADFIRRFPQGLDLDLGDHLREPYDRPVYIRDAITVHEGRRGSQSGQKAQLEGLFDLFFND